MLDHANVGHANEWGLADEPAVLPGAPLDTVWTIIGGQEQFVCFDIRDGMIRQIYGILNPDKLAFIRRAGSPPTRDLPPSTAEDQP